MYITTSKLSNWSEAYLFQKSFFFVLHRAVNWNHEGGMLYNASAPYLKILIMFNIEIIH